MGDEEISQRAMYLEAARRIEDEILRSNYCDNERLPSALDVASRLQINQATAARALQNLCDTHVAFRRRGLGHFVVPGALDQLHEARARQFVRDFVRPLLAEARLLGLICTLGDEVPSRSGPDADLTARHRAACVALRHIEEATASMVEPCSRRKPSTNPPS
jgi:GntR family transcriptional regulator